LPEPHSVENRTILRRREYLVDHPRQLGRLLRIVWAQLAGGGLDSGRGRLSQRTLLLTAEHQRGHLLAARIGEQPDQPRPEVISNKRHTASFPA
jgi:hypothetical protein